MILNNLAMTNQALGLNPQADELYRRALAIYEKVFGPDNPDVAINAQQSCRDVSHARALCRGGAALQACHRHRGKGAGARASRPSRCCSAISRLVHHHLGRHAEAEPLLLRAIAIREKALGAESSRAWAEPQQSCRGLSRARPLFRGGAALQARHRYRGKGVGAAASHPCAAARQSCRSFISNLAGMPKPSRCCGARSIFARRPWERTIPSSG